jgi:hypothetical protein
MFLPQDHEAFNFAHAHCSKLVCVQTRHLFGSPAA